MFTARVAQAQARGLDAMNTPYEARYSCDLDGAESPVLLVLIGHVYNHRVTWGSHVLFLITSQRARVVNCGSSNLLGTQSGGRGRNV